MYLKCWEVWKKIEENRRKSKKIEENRRQLTVFYSRRNLISILGAEKYERKSKKIEEDRRKSIFFSLGVPYLYLKCREVGKKFEEIQRKLKKIEDNWQFFTLGGTL